MLNVIYTEATCGEACWSALEDTCRCSCGGKNHGVLKTVDGIRPIRNCKIDGVRYQLKAIGKYSDIHKQSEELCQQAGPYKIDTYTVLNDKNEYETRDYKYYYGSTDKGSPARVKCASKLQIQNWIELGYFKSLDQYELYHNMPYLLWVKVEVI